DIIPVADSSETDQNSEPSLAVNPADPTQAIAGAFNGDFLDSGGVRTPFFLTTDGGATWSTYGQSFATDDKSLAWKLDGSGFLATVLTAQFGINTYSGTAAGNGFGTPINTSPPALFGLTSDSGTQFLT